MTYLNMDGIWFHESALNFILLLEVLCGFPDMAGVIRDPTEHRQGKASWDPEVPEGSSSQPASSETRAGMGMSRRWCAA